MAKVLTAMFLLTALSRSAHADIVLVLHDYDAVEQYFCTWWEDDDAHRLTVTCAPENYIFRGGDIMDSGFDNQPPGDWAYWVGIYGEEVAEGSGCTFRIAEIDGDKRGALLNCL